MATLNSVAHIKQKCCVTCRAGQNYSRALSIPSSQSCQPNRNLSGVGTKLKEGIFKSNNQINSAVTTRTWVQSKEWIRTWPNTGLVSERKNGGGTRLFEQQMLFFRVRGYCIVSTKIKTMSLCFFWLFEKMLSMQLFWNIQRKVNYPRVILEFEISHISTFVMVTQNIIRCNLNQAY